MQAIIGNSGWILLDKGLRATLGVAVGVCMARYLGVEKFGELNFAVAYVAIFGAIATLGLDTIVVRELARAPQRREVILGSVFTLKLGSGAAAAGAAVLGVGFLRPADPLGHALVAAIAAGLIFQSVDVVDFLFQSRVQSKYVIMARSGAFILLSLTRLALIAMQAAVLAFAWAASAEVAVAALGLLLVFCVRERRRWFGPASVRVMGEVLKESWPLMFAGLAIMLYMRIDQVMLAQLAGEREVGIYSSALRLSEVLYVIPTAIVSSAAPALTRLRAQSADLFRAELERFLRNLVRIGLVLALSISLFSGFLVSTLYGEQYAAAAPILSVHVWAAVFVFVGVGSVPYLVNEKLTRLMLYQSCLGAVANIILNLLLIPRYGGFGCAMATLASQALSTWLSNALPRRGRPLFSLQTRALLGAVMVRST